MEDIVRKIIAFAGWQVAMIFPAQKGYRNTSYPIQLTTGQMVNVIVYKNEPNIHERIRRTDQVSHFLHEQGFATRYTMRPLIRLSGISQPQRYVGIYNYLSGQPIEWHMYRQTHIKLLGQMMSDMHAILQSSTFNLPLVIDENLRLQKRTARYFADSSVQRAMREKLHLEGLTIDFSSLLKLCKQLPHHQPLHMDFVRGNILFSVQKPVAITGILDFEKAAFGPRVFDVARTLAFLLADCEALSSQKIMKYFLVSGYNKRGASEFKIPVFNGTSNLLEALISYFLAYDFYKFLRHNPYEFLYQNYHFLRTEKLLLERKVIRRV